MKVARLAQNYYSLIHTIMRILVKVGDESVIQDLSPVEFTTALEAKEHIEKFFSEGQRVGVKVLANEENEEGMDFAVFESKEEARNQIDKLAVGYDEGSVQKDTAGEGEIIV